MKKFVLAITAVAGILLFTQCEEPSAPGKTNELVGSWALDGTDTGIELFGDAQYTAGGTLLLDGDGDYAKIPFEFDSAEYTICFNFRANSASDTQQTIFSAYFEEEGTDTMVYHGIFSEILAGGYMRYCYRIPISNTDMSHDVDLRTEGENAYNDNEWHTVYLVRDDGIIKLYVDGALKKFMAGSSATLDSELEIVLGTVFVDNDPVQPREAMRFFDGEIADLQIYNYALF